MFSGFSVTFGIQEMNRIRPDLTDEQCGAVLEYFLESFFEYGGWNYFANMIGDYAEMLHPEPVKDDLSDEEEVV